jgi:FKBP-type peptidyl-prolyl cis-trans isomerase SlyD
VQDKTACDLLVEAVFYDVTGRAGAMAAHSNPKGGCHMAENNLKVTDDIVVSLDYTLRLESDEVVDTSEGGEPLEYIHGQGSIIPGLERELEGMSVGDSREVVLEPEDAYGDLDPDNYQEVPRTAFPPDMELEEGMSLSMRDRDTDEVIQAFVVETRDKSVLLDLNHPLAGEKLHFQVHIADLRPATDEELAHGHVHDGDESH